MKEVQTVLSERGKVYGDYKRGCRARSDIMKAIKKLYLLEHKNTMPLIFEEYLRSVVDKIVRLAVSPEHEDSWLDLIGYSTLILKEFRGEDDANKQCTPGP